MARKKKQDNDLIIIISAIAGCALLFISFMKFGPVGKIMDQTIRYLFGQYHLGIYLLFLSGLLMLIRYQNFKRITKRKAVGITLLLLAFLLLSCTIENINIVGFKSIQMFLTNSKAIFNYELSAFGGLLGVLLYGLVSELFALPGTYVVIVLLIVLGFIMTFNIRKIYRSLQKAFGYISNAVKKLLNGLLQAIKNLGSLFVAPKEDEYVEDEITDDSLIIDYGERRNDFIDISSQDALDERVPPTTDESSFTETESVHENKELNEPSVENLTKASPKTDIDYKLPSIDLLDKPLKNMKSQSNKNAAIEKGNHLISVLEQFNIPATLAETHIGPSVTKFEIRPDSSVKVSRISSISDNIKMELAATDIRIEAPVPGKNTVGIEIPNVETSAVKMYELIKGIPKQYDDIPLLFTLGKDLAGNTVYSDLTKLPHLLVAGATGSGKSVCINSIIVTILIRTTPEQVKLVLIDPKKVEFTHFADVPHLESPVVTDPAEASVALQRIVEKMDNRYELFAKVGVRNISGYYDHLRANPNDQLPPMPLIVVIIDELADLMIAAGKEVEQSIQRITQLARAAGIHLIVATQRPSTDVITGVIKANIPSRISFAVSSGIDSRTILDTGGAENLLGNGDMLYLPVGESAPIRLQGVYVSDDEIRKITDFVANQCEPEFSEQFQNLTHKKVDDTGAPVLPKDEIYDQVKLWVVREKKASTSLLQRTFGIGYNRAARIIDDLEADGIIGPQNGSRPREVFITESELKNENNEEEGN